MMVAVLFLVALIVIGVIYLRVTGNKQQAPTWADLAKETPKQEETKENADVA